MKYNDLFITFLSVIEYPRAFIFNLIRRNIYILLIFLRKSNVALKFEDLFCLNNDIECIFSYL